MGRVGSAPKSYCEATKFRAKRWHMRRKTQKPVGKSRFLADFRVVHFEEFKNSDPGRARGQLRGRKQAEFDRKSGCRERKNMQIRTSRISRSSICEKLGLPHFGLYLGSFFLRIFWDTHFLCGNHTKGLMGASGGVIFITTE